MKYLRIHFHGYTVFYFKVSVMDRLLRLGGGMAGLSQAPPPSDAPAVDTAEQVYISSLALLKMLKHGRAGVPMEVMGLMLGKINKIIIFLFCYLSVSLCLFL